MRQTSHFDVVLLSLVVVFLLAGSAEAGWTRLADVSGMPTNKAVKGGGSITALHDTIYLVVGNNTLDVMKYSIGGNTWTALNPGIPQGPKKKRAKKGAYIVDDKERLFMFKGGGTDEFYSYDPGAGSWATLASSGFTKGIKGGFATYVKLGADEYIYAGSGSNTSEWKRYNIASGAWEAANPPALPVAKVKVGSALACLDGQMYFLEAKGKEVNFYAAELESPTPTWTAKPALPLTSPSGKSKKVKEGGCLEELEGKLYAVKGGNTKEFWSYDPAANNWTYVGEVGDGAPFKGIKCGRSLTEGGDGIFCIIGNNTNELWHYTPPVADGPASAVTMQPMGLTATPNPTSGAATVRGRLPDGVRATLTVYNALGNIVQTATSFDDEFGTIELRPGVYVLRAQAGGSSVTSQLVVQK